MKMTSVITAILFFLAVLWCRHAGSEEGRWKQFGKSVTETLWYMDSETVTRPEDNIVAVWVKSVPDKKRSAGEAEEKEEPGAILKQIQEKYFGDYEYTDALWELDCAKSLFRLLYFSAHDKDGEVLTSLITPDAGWSSILPGSAGEALVGILCTH